MKQQTIGKEITLRRFSDSFINAFGDNAKIGLCFYFATLFKDIVYTVSSEFPILYLYGGKGSGKTSFGRFMTSLFAPNINGTVILPSATERNVDETIDRMTNIIVHVDEYSTDIDKEREKILSMLCTNLLRKTWI